MEQNQQVLVCHMQKLKEDGKVWCIFNAEQKQDVLFPCDPKPLVTISKDLVDFWHNIKVQKCPANQLLQGLGLRCAQCSCLCSLHQLSMV